MSQLEADSTPHRSRAKQDTCARPTAMITSNLKTEITKTFGVVPNCYGLRSDEAAAWMLSYARHAYVEAPFPADFKEKLFVHLSRFCDSPYCIARHIGFLMGEGFVGGDPLCPPLEFPQVMTFLNEPLAGPSGLIRHFSRLRDFDRHSETWSREAEPSLFAVCSAVFLKLGDRRTAVQELANFLGDSKAERLLLLLSYIAFEQQNCELSPSLEHDLDVVQLLAKHHALSQWLSTYRSVVAQELGSSLASERLRLSEAQQQLASQATRLINAATGNRIDPADVLSDRELATFACIGRGLSTRDIAAELGLSAKTIETYRARIKKKLDIQKMSELATEATSWVLRTQSS